MKIFISSLILGMDPFRAAAREAVTTLRHEPIMAEDFGASPNSPQIACLTGVRQADLVVSMLGKDYGALQPSGLSATHEEYREAKGQKPVLAFVQSGVDREPKGSPPESKVADSCRKRREARRAQRLMGNSVTAGLMGLKGRIGGCSRDKISATTRCLDGVSGRRYGRKSLGRVRLTVVPCPVLLVM
jgi:hypothetical protein